MSNGIERLDFGDELWALVATEACHPVVGLFGSKEDAWVAAMAKAEDGTELVQEPAVMPCLVEDGEVIVCNDFTVETHAQLKERLLTSGKPYNRGAGTCRSGQDGECNWSECPQARDGEPAKTGRHCPLWEDPEDDLG